MWVQKLGGGGVAGLAYAPDGRILFVADAGRSFTAWDVVARQGRRLFKLADRQLVNGFALVGERYLATKLYDRVYAWDREAEQLVAPLTGVPLPDSLVVRGTPGRVVYPSASRLSLRAWAPGAPDDGEHLAGPLPGAVRAYDLSPDGRTVAFVGAYSTEVVLLAVDGNAVTGRFHATAAPGLAWGVRFAPDGRTVAVFCGKHVEVWDVSRPARASGPVRIDNRHGQDAFAFHPTAPVFAALDADGALTLFDVATGAALRSLDFALGRNVRYVCFAPDGLTCAVGGSNKQFAVFDVDV